MPNVRRHGLCRGTAGGEAMLTAHEWMLVLVAGCFFYFFANAGD
jgi:hypothetical protein